MTESPSSRGTEPGRIVRSTGRTRLDTLGSRVAHASRVRVVVAAARHRCGPRHDDDARAGRHRVCGGIRVAGDQRPLRDHRAAACVCAVRSQPHSRPRTGLGARGRDPRSRAAPFGGRSAACRRAGRNDGDRVWCRVRRRGPGASRLHHRTAVETDPLRLHERHRADRDPEPDPEALRLLRERGRTAASERGESSRRCGRKHQRHRRLRSAAARSR